METTLPRPVAPALEQRSIGGDDFYEWLMSDHWTPEASHPLFALRAVRARVARRRARRRPSPPSSAGRGRSQS